MTIKASILFCILFSSSIAFSQGTNPEEYFVNIELLRSTSKPDGTLFLKTFSPKNNKEHKFYLHPEWYASSNQIDSGLKTLLTLAQRTAYKDIPISYLRAGGTISSIVLTFQNRPNYNSLFIDQIILFPESLPKIVVRDRAGTQQVFEISPDVLLKDPDFIKAFEVAPNLDNSLKPRIAPLSMNPGPHDLYFIKKFKLQENREQFNLLLSDNELFIQGAVDKQFKIQLSNGSNYYFSADFINSVGENRLKKALSLISENKNLVNLNFSDEGTINSLIIHNTPKVMPKTDNVFERLMITGNRYSYQNKNLNVSYMMDDNLLKILGECNSNYNFNLVLN